MTYCCGRVGVVPSNYPKREHRQVAVCIVSRFSRRIRRRMYFVLIDEFLPANIFRILLYQSCDCAAVIQSALVTSLKFQGQLREVWRELLNFKPSLTDSWQQILRERSPQCVYNLSQDGLYYYNCSKTIFRSLFFLIVSILSVDKV